MTAAPRTTALGEFELLVLLSTLSLAPDAYPAAIAKDLVARTGRRASRAAVLITLERLEAKQHVGSRYGDRTPERGGRPKRFFRVKPRGLKAIRTAVAQIETMTTGLRNVLKAKCR